MNARVWAVINQKGGVGKTTTAITLAAASAEDGQPTLLVDLDPHASASRYFGRAGTELFDALTHPDVPARIQPTGVAALDLLAASTELATLGRDNNLPGAGLALRRLLARIDDYPRIVLDGPPTLGVLMINALAAADLVVVPTLTDPLSHPGVAGMDHTLSQIQRSLGRRPPWRIVATQFDRRTRSAHDGHRQLTEQWGAAMWEEHIPIDTLLRDASAASAVPQQFAPDSRAVRAYRRLYRDLTTPRQLERNAA